MDADRTIRALAQKLELNNSGFDAAGQLSIDLGAGAVIHAARIDENNIEWSVPLKDFDFADPAIMSVMLDANCMGAGTNAGRLSVDSDLAAYYGERWVVRGMTEREAELRFDELAATAAYWLTDGVDRLLEQASERRATQRDTPKSLDDVEDAVVMRV